MNENMRHTYLIFEIFYWFNGCDKYIRRHKRQNCRSVRFTDHLYNIHAKNRNRNENTTHKNSNCRSVKFTDHLYMRGRKKELPPLGIGRTMWPPPTPGQDCSIFKKKIICFNDISSRPKVEKGSPSTTCKQNNKCSTWFGSFFVEQKLARKHSESTRYHVN